MAIDDALTQLRTVSEHLSRVDEYRAEVMDRRNDHLVAARRAGATWSQLMAASGLSVGAVQTVLKRWRAGGGVLS